MSKPLPKARLLALTLPLLAIAVVGDLVNQTFSGFTRNLFSSRPSTTAYETAEVTVGAIQRVVATSGPVRPWVTVQVGSQLSGQIRRVRADFNSEVKEGDILAELDATMFQAKVEQAEADLAMAKASLVNQNAALQKAQATMVAAESARSRQQVLSVKGITSQANLDTVNKDMRIAQAEIAVTNAQIENARANVLQRESMLKQARIELERTLIRSPITGIVVSRTVDVGQTVAASLQAPELFRIAQNLRNIHIEAQVNEADIGSIAVGNTATFAVDSFPGRGFEGKVAQIRIAPNEVQSVVTYAVLIEARNDDLKLFPGMTASVRIQTERRDQALRLPAAALRFKPRGVLAADPTGDAAAGSKEERQERQVEKLKEQLNLTDVQVKALTASLAQTAEKRTGENKRRETADEAETAANGKTPAKARGRSSDRTRDALIPLLTPEQHAIYEARRTKREATRSAHVWVVGANGEPERRSIRLGLADARFAEVVSGELKSGEQVIIGTRKAAVK